MKTHLTIAAVLMAGVLVMGAVSATYAEDFKSSIVKGLIQSVGPDGMKAVLSSMAQELARNGELRKQLIQTLGPEGVRSLVESVSKGQTVATPAAARGPVRGPVRGSLSTTEAAAVPPAEKRAPAPAAAPAGLGPLVMITHPSNPLDGLTMDQVRKLVTGEYTNWSQVGGADLPVKVVTVRGAPAMLQSVLKVSIVSTAAVLPFNSFIIPSVAESRGAIGFLPTVTMEQLDFVGGHRAVKTIAVRMDEGPSEAITPTRTTVVNGAYPMMASQTAPGSL